MQDINQEAASVIRCLAETIQNQPILNKSHKGFLDWAEEVAEKLEQKEVQPSAATPDWTE